MKLDSRSLALWSAVVMLIAAALLIQRGQDVQAQHLRKPLSSLSLSLGSWRAVGPERNLDAPTLELLKPQDYLMRNYLDPRGRSVHVVHRLFRTPAGGTDHPLAQALPARSGLANRKPQIG